MGHMFMSLIFQVKMMPINHPGGRWPGGGTLIFPSVESASSILFLENDCGSDVSEIVHFARHHLTWNDREKQEDPNSPGAHPLTTRGRPFVESASLGLFRLNVPETSADSTNGSPSTVSQTSTARPPLGTLFLATYISIYP